LFATAPRNDVWMLLEVSPPWGAKALPESRLPDEIKHYLNTQLETIPNSRVQLIRQQASQDPGFAFYVARTSAVDPVMYRFQVPSYEALLSLDIQAILNGLSDEQPTKERLYFVCINGRRDACCSRLGAPLYDAMRAYSGQSVWQVTHIGGHRFAPTFVCLPEGIYYGRVDLNDVKMIVDEHEAGRIHLDNFRGRCGYDAPVQAAEYYVRRESGILEIDALQLLDLQIIREHQWKISFASPEQQHIVEIVSEISDFEVYETTGNPEKSRQVIYGLEGYESRSAFTTG
jgi:hypothetical protein